ncbi:hypothetical protein C2869_22020 (plasmid) [Saccharobesus litoralis]|uniref:Uncharacterized protein n=2 Tax=Saccharobesus litoralis TaxID=2172099 RepID=A0A2S0VYD3_9ALTE|nr:hypothetical protein C2869_22020 [Saccharobesus litoralis]
MKSLISDALLHQSKAEVLKLFTWLLANLNEYTSLIVNNISPGELTEEGLSELIELYSEAADMYHVLAYNEEDKEIKEALLFIENALLTILQVFKHLQNPESEPVLYTSEINIRTASETFSEYWDNYNSDDEIEFVEVA